MNRDVDDGPQCGRADGVAGADIGRRDQFGMNTRN
jgi:hypothetical protein